jgi:hypothetical protein
MQEQHSAKAEKTLHLQVVAYLKAPDASLAVWGELREDAGRFPDLDAAISFNLGLAAVKSGQWDWALACVTAHKQQRELGAAAGLLQAALNRAPAGRRGKFLSELKDSAANGHIQSKCLRVQAWAERFGFPGRVLLQIYKLGQIPAV